MVQVNEYTGEKELIVDATITSLGKKVLTNAKNTEYRIASVKATMPDGKTQKGSTLIWEKLQESNEYEPGDEIQLAIQLEGDYAGYSKIFLGGASKFDVAEYATEVGVKVEA
jgi:hypothetical protein